MKSFALIRRLVLAQMKLHPARAVITTLGVIASTCAVVWVVSGYDALVSQFDENAEKYLGRYDALVLPSVPPGAVATIDAQLVESLRQDPGVLELNPIHQSRVTVSKVPDAVEKDAPETPLGLLIGSRPPVYGAPPIDPILVSTPAPESPYELLEGTWLSEKSQELPAVISQSAAQQVGVSVGEEILVTSLANQVRLKVVGIVDQIPEAPSLGPQPGGGGPATKSARPPRKIAPPKKQPKLPFSESHVGIPTAFVQGPATNAVYVRPEVAEKINGFPAHPNVLQIAFRDGIEVAKFQNVWKSRFEASKPSVRLVDYDDVRGGLETARTAASQRTQAWAATGMASMAAIFIIFSTLSMGVSERTREFAMLRAIALTRGQLAFIIAFESVVLAVLGWLGGLVAGWLLVEIGSRVFPGLFGSTVTLGVWSVTLSGLTALAGAMGAAILPAWRAMRIKPLDAMASPFIPPPMRGWIVLACIGTVLAAFAPLTVFVTNMPDDWRTWTYTTVTWPALFIGMILLTPAAVLICERWFGPLVTSLFRLDSRLVKSQLSSNMWRTIGAALALSLGLALYASTQTWGYSMLQPFLPGKWLPDMLVAFHPIGLGDDGIESVQNVEGVRSDQIMPLAIEQARFDWGDKEAPPRLRYDNAVLFGIDPQRAFGSDDPFLKVDFVEGDPQAVIQALAAGGACVVSEDFQMLTGIGSGDELSFTPPSGDGGKVTYRVVGVVSLPGWHWITKFSGVRRHFVRTATMIFANRDDVRRNFHLQRTEFFWLNLDPSIPLATVEAGLQQIAERNAGQTFQAEGYGEVKAYRPFARATATETIRKAITMHAGNMIWGMSQLPLVTLMIMSLAVANAVIASFRARIWEFGILRSVGITRWQLVRLIVAETILIGLVACTLSLLFGLIAGWCGVGMARYGGWFAGPPTFLIPWTQLSLGFLLTLMLCLLAALWPAIRAGRAEPLALLQAGRGTI